MIYTILLAYLAFTFLGSLRWKSQSEQNPESYFLANRGLTTFGLFFTILATNFSAFYFLGFAGQGYKMGFSHYVIMSLGTGLAAISFFIIGVPAWRLGKAHGYITASELIFGQTRSRVLAMTVSSTMIVFTLPYLALQIIGGGYLLSNLTDGDLSYSLSIILLTAFTIAYVVIGGMESVARTDLKQGLLVIIFMFLAVLLIGQQLGGLQTANWSVFDHHPELFALNGEKGSFTASKWFSMLVFWIFCIPMFPQLFSRFYLAKTEEHLRQSALLYALIPLFISILPVLIGVWGHLSFEGLEGKNIDQVLPLMLKEHTSPLLSALVMTGAIAAFMSTLDSQLLALSTMITRDFMLPIRKSIDLPTQVRWGKIWVGLLALIGLTIGFFPFDTIFDMGKMAFSGLAVLFPVVAAVIYKPEKINHSWAAAGIISGLAVIVGSYYQFFNPPLLNGFEPYLPALLVVIFFLFLGSIINSIKKRPA